VGGLNLERAKKELKLADHMVYVTMPLVGDGKLFISVIDHLFMSITESIGKFLEREKNYKRLELLPQDMKERVELFKRRYAAKLGLDGKTIEMLDHIVAASGARSNSQSQFVRNDKFVIISRDYRVHAIDKVAIKRYISLQKELIIRLEASKDG